jgi:hypothetical protein
MLSHNDDSAHRSFADMRRYDLLAIAVSSRAAKGARALKKPIQRRGKTIPMK